MIWFCFLFGLYTQHGVDCRRVSLLPLREILTSRWAYYSLVWGVMQKQQHLSSSFPFTYSVASSTHTHTLLSICAIFCVDIFIPTHTLSRPFVFLFFFLLRLYLERWQKPPFFPLHPPCLLVTVLFLACIYTHAFVLLTWSFFLV